jgi:hypothetical protein
MSHIRRGLLGLLVGACAALGCWEKEKDANEAPPDDPAAARLRAAAAERTGLLRGHHDRSVDQFVKTEGFGGQRLGILVRHSHQPPNLPPSLHLPPGVPELSELPPGHPLPENPTPWLMENVELVSLLKHDRPGVYPATGLGMGNFQMKKQTRDLDDFERSALAKLRDGEDLQVKESPDQIRVLGAIRARQECAKCHDKPAGTLLGAFSYVFKPGVPKQQAPPVQNPPAPPK